MSLRLCVLLVAVLVLVCSCQIGDEPATPPGGTTPALPTSEDGPATAESEDEPTTRPKEETIGMEITSTAFREGEMIPQKYTCDGQDISPPLAWTGVPDRVKSLALITDDPDAPGGTWVHWVAFNISPDVTELPEAVPTDETLPTGGTQGNNSWSRPGYGGPCPPGGTHRYFFKLYALDTELALKAGAGKKDVEKAMKGHVLAEGQVMGKYKRS